jgi:DNA-binding HxlR family transcriptional regulator
MPQQLTPRQIAALRAFAASPGGLRAEAYPTVMAGLVEMGLVREGVSKMRPRRPVWLLTKAGRDLIKLIGTGEPEE